MSKRYWGLTMQAELDEETGKVTLKCPRRTRPPSGAVECEQDKDMDDLDIDELRADLKSAAEEDPT